MKIKNKNKNEKFYRNQLICIWISFLSEYLEFVEKKLFKKLFK